MGEGPSFEQIDAAAKAHFRRALNWSLEFTNVFIDDATLNRDDEVADMPAMVKAYKRQITLGNSAKTC